MGASAQLFKASVWRRPGHYVAAFLCNTHTRGNASDGTGGLTLRAGKRSKAVEGATRAASDSQCLRRGLSVHSAPDYGRRPAAQDAAVQRQAEVKSWLTRAKTLSRNQDNHRCFSSLELPPPRTAREALTPKTAPRASARLRVPGAQSRVLLSKMQTLGD